MNPLPLLLREGQSIWYDFISRDFISSGTMKRMVDLGVRGMTSNPTIFEKAIGGGSDYDDQIADLAARDLPTPRIATELFVTDVRDACDVMRPVFDSANGTDGFISIEVNPLLAAKTDETVEEAHHLWTAVDRPNLMVKIPATDEGIPAIRRCLSDGININITLMFSRQQYRDVVEAFMSGLEDRLARGEDISRIRSVASIFVSRIDTMIDKRLETIGSPDALALRGRIALANTKLVYQDFLRLFSGPRWERLASHGATVQRPLWASTSTKNPDYPALLYVEPLIGPNTVNTVPPETLEAIQNTLKDVRPHVEEGIDEAKTDLEKLKSVGVDLDEVMEKLIEEGVDKFSKSYGSLTDKIEEKRQALARK